MKESSLFPTVKVRGKYLHSPYNPVREAEKIISAEDYGEKTWLILFEPGLGYCAELLLDRYPHLRLLIISPLKLIKEKLRKNSRVLIWEGDLRDGLHSYLSRNIHESDIISLAYLPWPPAVRLLAEEAGRAGETLGRFLNRLKANQAHLTGFSRANLRNSIINFLSASPPVLPHLSGMPVLVAASGPSLEDNLPEIRKHVRNYFIISLPSAVTALLSAGIRPHLIISTDPGYWAARHFRHFPSDIPVGLGLSGKSDYGNRRTIFPIMNQQTYTDRAFLGQTDLPKIDSTGSVALSAMEFVLSRGASSLTFAGLDLCMRDIKSHTSPHSFDNLLLSWSSRFNSLLRIHYSRVSDMTLSQEGLFRYGHALEQYKSWLEQRSFPLPLYRLNSGTPHLTGISEITGLENYGPIREEWSPVPFYDSDDRKEIVRRFLRKERDRARIFLNDPGSFHRPDRDGSSDFLYTLIPEDYGSLKKDLALGKNVKELREKAEDRIMNIFRESEDLCERLSE